MIIKNLIDEDYSNYKQCSMFIGFPSCNFKCEREAGCTGMCQNSELAKAPSIEISYEAIIDRYLFNPLSSAIVCGGLEPLDSWLELSELVAKFRHKTNDPIIIYTGYKPEEVNYAIQYLKCFSNIIIKFGRFIPNQEKHFDEVLGIYLASLNQYAEKIS